MYTFRDFSVRLLYRFFKNSGLTPNQITVSNFFTLGLGSVILFALGKDIPALIVAGVCSMVDHIDGTLARDRGGNTKVGEFLDTSLDWLYLMLIIGAISYAHNIMVIGYVTLIILTFGNWVQYNGNVNVKIYFPFGISHLLVLGILTGHAELGITGIMFTQGIRTSLLYWRSIWNKFKV